MKHLHFLATVTLGLVIVIGLSFGVYALSNNFLHSDARSRDHRCDSNHIMHTVHIQHNHVTPLHTQAKLCESLKIVNLDSTERLMAFGLHDHHASYDGVTERLLSKNQSVQVTLNRTGTFEFHDHQDDNVAGEFTVR
jgi:hypothetical protein